MKLLYHLQMTKLSVKQEVLCVQQLASRVGWNWRNVSETALISFCLIFRCFLVSRVECCYSPYFSQYVGSIGIRSADLHQSLFHHDHHQFRTSPANLFLSLTSPTQKTSGHFHLLLVPDTEWLLHSEVRIFSTTTLSPTCPNSTCGMDQFRAMFMVRHSASTVQYLSFSSKDLHYFWGPRLWRRGKEKTN
jgi:hypothetical protein